jgi:hypothetical protein
MSRKLLILSFDDFVVGTGAVYSAVQHNGTLGQFDKLALQAVVDSVTGSGGLACTVQVEHSSDQRNWSNKSGTAEINAGSISTTATTSLSGYETGANPSHGFVRLRVQLGGTTPSGHVRVWVCARDES